MGRLGLRMLGWRVTGNFPDLPRMVVIVAPHTSNWDFVAGFAAYLAMNLEASWFGKHTLFHWPMGGILRQFGGIPIERAGESAAGVVEQQVAEFGRRQRMVLALTPEGTRRKVLEWKSGFYRIAVQAGVPIVPVAMDYATRRVIIGAAFYPTGSYERDISAIRGRFDGVTARYPAQF
ncbi:MAG: lysophospholipid acyltransferase family protein [Gemmatimonadaceae bacterium]